MKFKVIRIRRIEYLLRKVRKSIYDQHLGLQRETIDVGAGSGGT